MTDLPIMNPEPKSWWLAVHESRGTCVLHRRTATLEDVRAVLNAAGYVVVEKSTYENNRRDSVNMTKENAPVEPYYEHFKNEEGVSSERAGREEPGTLGRQPPEDDVPSVDGMVLHTIHDKARFTLRTTFADLHEVEKKYWISLLPCSECGGPVNYKICVTCYEIAEGRMRDLALAVREGLAKRDWGHVKKGMLTYDGIKIGGITEPDGATVGAALLQQKLDEAKRIADDAIKGLILVGEGAAAETLINRMQKL